MREHLDCNDADAATSPREIETQCDDIDQNCDGHDDCDADHDGLLWPYDCDDDDPAVTHQCRGPAVPSEREP